MPIIIVDNYEKKDFELPPEGVERAVCIAIYDLGSHMNKGFEGKAPSLERKVRLTWELVDTTMKDGKPFVIGEKYTMSLGEKANLRKLLKQWRSKDISEAEQKRFDIECMLGCGCQISIAHNPGKGDKANRIYANLASIMPLPRGLPVPSPVNPFSRYSISDGQNFPPEMPDWIKKEIRSCHEFTSPRESAPSHGSTPPPRTEADDLRDEAEAAFHATTSKPSPANAPVPWESEKELY